MAMAAMRRAWLVAGQACGPALQARWARLPAWWSETIVEAGRAVPGVTAVIEDINPNYQGPAAVFRFDSSWAGPSAEIIQERLAAMDPSIQVGTGHPSSQSHEIYVCPTALEEGEAEVIAVALRAQLASIR